MKDILDIILTQLSDLNDWGATVIAGGAVRDTLLGKTPKDYDLFILDCKWSKAEEVRDYLKNYRKIDHELTHHLSEPYLTETIEVAGVEVQVMISPHKTVEELINSFDWNVSMFAYDGEFYAKMHLDEIKIGGTLSLNRITYPWSTLRRGFRFSERFKMRFPRSEVRKIIFEINKSSQNFYGGLGI